MAITSINASMLKEPSWCIMGNGTNLYYEWDANIEVNCYCNATIVADSDIAGPGVSFACSIAHDGQRASLLTTPGHVGIYSHSLDHLRSGSLPDLIGDSFPSRGGRCFRHFLRHRVTIT